jgi:hypothetical protein
MSAGGFEQALTHRLAPTHGHSCFRIQQRLARDQQADGSHGPMVKSDLLLGKDQRLNQQQRPDPASEITRCDHDCLTLFFALHSSSGLYERSTFAGNRRHYVKPSFLKNRDSILLEYLCHVIDVYTRSNNAG